MRFRCPVCMFPSLPYPPSDYHICPCCSTEFGNDDDDYTHVQLLEMWIAGGTRWFFGRPPEGWNPWTQLLVAGRGAFIPSEFRAVRLQVKTSAESTVTTRFPTHGYLVAAAA